MPPARLNLIALERRLPTTRLQRYGEREPLPVGPVPVAVVLLHQHLEHAPRHLSVLVQPVERQARVDQAANDVGQRMQPFDAGGVRKMRRRIGVVLGIGHDDRLALEVGRKCATISAQRRISGNQQVTPQLV